MALKSFQAIFYHFLLKSYGRLNDLFSKKIIPPNFLLHYLKSHKFQISSSHTTKMRVIKHPGGARGGGRPQGVNNRPPPFWIGLSKHRHFIYDFIQYIKLFKWFPIDTTKIINSNSNNIKYIKLGESIHKESFQSFFTI